MARDIKVTFYTATWVNLESHRMMHPGKCNRKGFGRSGSAALLTAVPMSPSATLHSESLGVSPLAPDREVKLYGWVILQSKPHTFQWSARSIEVTKVFAH